jgi:hypothetical protein
MVSNASNTSGTMIDLPDRLTVHDLHRPTIGLIHPPEPAVLPVGRPGSLHELEPCLAHRMSEHLDPYFALVAKLGDVLVGGLPKAVDGLYVWEMLLQRSEPFTGKSRHVLLHAKSDLLGGETGIFEDVGEQHTLLRLFVVVGKPVSRIPGIVADLRHVNGG